MLPGMDPQLVVRCVAGAVAGILLVRALQYHLGGWDDDDDDDEGTPIPLFERG